MRSTARHVQGFKELRLRSAGVEIGVIPELGAKVISLTNLCSGREWMWRPGPELKLFKNRSGEDFARSTMTGWDECVPTISPCEHQSRTLPDHGEAWSAPWQVDENAFASGMLHTSIDLPVSRLRFVRTLRLSENQITARYSVTNLAGESQEFLWAMHPLIEIHPGDRLELTDETKSFLRRESWLDTLDFEPSGPRFAKVFAGPLRKGRAGVINSQSADRLGFSWDPEENPFLGIWLTRGGWNGYHHLALEVTNAPTDSLREAVGLRKMSLPPNATRDWSVTITVEPASKST